MKRFFLAILIAISMVLSSTAPSHGHTAEAPDPGQQRPVVDDVDIGRAIVSGRHHTDVARAAAGVGAPGGFSRMPVEWRGRDGSPAARHSGPVALSVYVVAPVNGRVTAGQVLPMHHVGATSLVDRADFFDIHLGYLEYLVAAALTPAQRRVFHNGDDRFEFRFMASTNSAIGTVGVRGPATGARVPAAGQDLRPAGLPPLVMVGDGGGADGDEPNRTHAARTICSSAFGSAFWPAGLQVREVFTSDPRAELAYVKTSPTSVARVRYSSTDETQVDIGAALWGLNLDFSTQKTVARELSHTYSTSTGPNQYRAITTTLYARQFLLRCMIPNPFNPVIELTRPHQYAEYHAEAAEGLVPRGRIAHRWLYSCQGQHKTQVGSRDSGGTWAQHRSTSIGYVDAVQLRPGGVRAALVMDLRQRIGRTDEVSIVYEKVNRGRLSICGFAFKIPSQSQRVRAQGACNPAPCRPVLY
ncbi:MAG: hypothetical protein ACR2QE_11215 [Acidimicrobiales bacterium]